MKRKSQIDEEKGEGLRARRVFIELVCVWERIG